MKMTLDLPNDLVREMKLRAVLDGKKLKDTAAALITAGIEAQAAKGKEVRPLKGFIKLPLFEGAEDAPARHMTMEQIIAADQEILNQLDLAHLPHPL
jgi:hypothetical protein